MRLSFLAPGSSFLVFDLLSFGPVFSFSKKGNLPTTGLLKDRDFCSTKSEISSIRISRSSTLRIRSAFSRHLTCKLGGSLSMIFRIMSGLSILLELPMDLRMFVQLDNRIDNPSRDSASSALMRGPFVTWCRHAIAILCFWSNLHSSRLLAFV